MVQELDEPERFCRDGPGLVAALCIRDHLDELDDSDFRWCAERIDLEICRNLDCHDETVRCARGMDNADRAGASIVSLLAVHDRTAKVLDAMDLLSLALTHPVDEVADYANGGVGAFLELWPRVDGAVKSCWPMACLYRSLRFGEEYLPVSALLVDKT